MEQDYIERGNTEKDSLRIPSLVDKFGLRLKYDDYTAQVIIVYGKSDAEFKGTRGKITMRLGMCYDDIKPDRVKEELKILSEAGEEKITLILLGKLINKYWLQVAGGKLSSCTAPPKGKDKRVIDKLEKKIIAMLE